MNFSEKKIGIWGLGLVGESAVKFLSAHGATLQVMEKKPLTEEQITLLNEHNVEFIEQNAKTLAAFFNDNDHILPSPGIDLRPYSKHENKWLSEIDIFGHFFTKPIISITGTVGKTTVASLLGDIIRASGKRVLVGGNIGTPLLTLIDQQEDHDLAIVELSSFQLAISKTCAPYLTIWTNIYPNHLDWHGSMEEYLQAKANCVRFQCKNHKALVPLLLANFLKKENVGSSLRFFCHHIPDNMQEYHAPIYSIDNDFIVKIEQGKQTQLANIQNLPTISHTQNWLPIVAALDILNIPLQASTLKITPAQHLEHRLEHVARINGIDFYNDSKATIAQATLAAVSSFGNRDIILLLGGLSKGVNRSTLIKELPNNVKHIICFGKEAFQLHELCRASGRAASSFSSLEQAYTQALKKARSGDIILLSPGGASFDLFPNYHERGKRFKELVKRNSVIG